MMKVLITGGAGYIGSMIATRALQNNLEVRAVDALWFEKKIPLAHIGDPHYEFICADLADEAVVERCLEGVDFVVHTAAVVGEPASNKFPDLTRRVNREASLRLIDRFAKTNGKGFIFFSTCSNYGVVDGMATETTPLKPVSLYAETKVDVENHLINVAKGLDWVICRLSTVYGSSQRMRFDLTVNDFTVNALHEGFLDIFLPYSYRPYIHVTDVARVILALIENFDTVKGEIFNVGFEGENYQKIQIAEIVKKFVPGLKINIVKAGSDARDYQVDFSKLRRFLDIDRTYTVEDGVRQIMGLFHAGIIGDYRDRKYYNTSPLIREDTTI